ncbi:MAG: glycosyltransferase family 87 protein [Acidobacteriota bacterium]
MKLLKRKEFLYFFVFFIIFISLTLIYFLKVKKEMVDFSVYYKAGERIINGESLYRIEDGHYQFKYPPFFAFLFSFISFFPLNIAKLIWFYLEIIASILIFYFSIKLINRDDARNLMVIFLSFLILAKFYGHEINLGQVNSVMNFFLILMVYFFVLKKDFLSGLFLSISVIIKPYYSIFLIYFFFKRKIKLVLSSLIFTTIFFFIPTIFYGLKGNFLEVEKWIKNLSVSTPSLISSQDNVSLMAFFTKNVTKGKDVLIFYFIFLILFFFLLIYLHSIGEINVLKNQEILESSMILIMIPLISPLGWDYTLISSTLGVVILVKYFNRFETAHKFILVLNFALIGGTLYDLMGRKLYSEFMNYSVLTINFLIIIFYLSLLRLKKIL